ncbi:MAG: hypothetical protein RL108_852 [Bacteroidota bacterium]|jgi:hypothetical protein
MQKLALFFLFSTALSAQIKGVVKDSITRKPIPYANIWVENENIGTTSEANGTFEINASRDKRVQVSIIGYHQKKDFLDANNEILLKQKPIELEKVTFFNYKNSETIKAGKAEFKRITHLQGKYPQILAKKFDYDSIYKRTPYLKEIEVFTQSEIKVATFKLRILLYDKNTDLPIIDLIDEDIIVSVKKGRNKTKIDVSKYKIKFPEAGIVIGLESMIIDANKYSYSYKYNGLQNESIVYAPAIICNHVDEENAFISYNSNWFKKKPEYHLWEKKYVVVEPAINLTLTN